MRQGIHDVNSGGATATAAPAGESRGGRRGRAAAGVVAILAVSALSVVLPDDDAAASPSTVTRTSGLAWPSGVYARQNTAGVAAFAAYRKRPIDISYSAAPVHGSTTLDQVTSASFMYDLHRGYPGWLSVGYCLMGTGDHSPANFARGARGEFDAKWQRAAQILRNSGFADRTVVRIDWEYNISHCGNHEGVGLADYKSYYRRVAQIFKAVHPNVKVDFVASGGSSKWSALGGNPMAAYPGDDVVDFIGMDDYDVFPTTAAGTEASWVAHADRPWGLNAWMRTARSRGKVMSVPEWGVGNGRTNWPGHDGGDNPFYVQKMFEWFRGNAGSLAYEMYFDDPNDYINSSILPPLTHGPRGPNTQASARYASLYAGATGTAPAPSPSSPAPTAPTSAGVRVTGLSGSGSLAPGATYTVAYGLSTTGALATSNLQIVMRDAAGANFDFGHRTGFTLNGRQSFTASRTLPAGTYTFRVGYASGGKWTLLSPVRTVTISSVPKATVLGLSGSGTLTAGAPFTVSYRLGTTGTITTSRLQVVMRNASGSNFDFGHRTGVALGGTQSFSARRTLPAGSYTYRIGYYANGAWTLLSPTRTITVR